MKTLETKQEIAIAINMHEMPVVRIDLADADEYGIKSQKVLIDNGKFRRLNPTDPDMPYLVRAEIRAFVDEKKFTFASYGCCLSNTFGYHDMEELAEFFNTSRRVIYSESVDDLLLAAKTLHFAMQQIVLPKFAALSPEPPEPIEKSIFDDYDAEQDAQAGYVDETADRWLICKQNVEAVTRLAIRVLRESYTDVQREPLGRLLEYVAYEIEHTEK